MLNVQCILHALTASVKIHVSFSLLRVDAMRNALSMLIKHDVAVRQDYGEIHTLSVNSLSAFEMKNALLERLACKTNVKILAASAIVALHQHSASCLCIVQLAYVQKE